jgi:hypothetical protein
MANDSNRLLERVVSVDRSLVGELGQQIITLGIGAAEEHP